MASVHNSTCNMPRCLPFSHFLGFSDSISGDLEGLRWTLVQLLLVKWVELECLIQACLSLFELTPSFFVVLRLCLKFGGFLKYRVLFLVFTEEFDF